MLFMLGPGEEYWTHWVYCVCGHKCSFEIDVCPSCEHNLRLLCVCDTCDKHFWYEGQERCPNCGAVLPNYEDSIPKIEMVIAKHQIGLTFMTVDIPYVFYHHHALLPSKDPRVQASVRSFGIPMNENIYMVVIAQRQLTDNCKGFAICEHGIYCRDMKEWHGLIRWNDFADQRNMPIKSFMGMLQIGSHDFNIIKHPDCSCSDLKDYLTELQYYINLDNVKWFDETAETSLYHEEDQPSLYAPTSPGNSRIGNILKTTIARHAFSDTGIVCQGGLPIENNKAEKSRISFNIPDSDKIYFIASGQIMGGVSENSKGFAIGTSGIYYRTNGKECGFYDWEVFSNIQITVNTLSYVKIGSVEFQVSGRGKVLKLLLDLQSEVRNNISAVMTELQAAAQHETQLKAERLKRQDEIQSIRDSVKSKLMENYEITEKQLTEIEDVLCIFSNLYGMDADGIIGFFKEKNIEFAGVQMEDVASYIAKSSPEKVADWVLRQLVAIFQIKLKAENKKAPTVEQIVPAKPETANSAGSSHSVNTEVPVEHSPEKICPSCSKGNKSTARFCAYCGSSLEITRFCTQCGTKLRPGKKFCSGCGAKIE